LNQNGSGVVEKIDMATLYVSGASTVLFEKMNLQELALKEADWTTYARDGVPEPTDDQSIGVSIREPNPWVQLAGAIPADAVPICQAPALTYLEGPETTVWFSKAPDVQQGLRTTYMMLGDLVTTNTLPQWP
jgi:hypothetical protein